ncbi:hypothetical protein [Candidatus Similichlamydia epinepheli]|uniref:hypothetical protein n=1 Tax=Candidatus Similichlamydia epinepheli TaxID=1903953 RepID=UPI001300BEB8|nr:hypothetical protein [Candidatus Similichlamydia epinepheli]
MFLRVLVIAAALFSLFGAVSRAKNFWNCLNSFDWKDVSKKTYLDVVAESFTCVMAVGIVVAALSHFLYLPPLLFTIFIIWALSCLSLLLEGKVKFGEIGLPPSWLSSTFVLFLGAIAFRDIACVLN